MDEVGRHSEHRKDAYVYLFVSMLINSRELLNLTKLSGRVTFFSFSFAAHFYNILLISRTEVNPVLKLSWP